MSIRAWNTLARLIAGAWLLAAAPLSAQPLRDRVLDLVEQNLNGPQRPHPAVVRVIVPEGKGTQSLGSGTLIDVNDTHGLVVTNWHVIEGARGPITVVFPDGFRSEGQLLKSDRDWDLAALAIRRPNVTPVPLATQAPRPGEILTIAGYGSGNYRAASGPCTQYVAPGMNHPYEMLELATSARQGDSGGPIFNSRGELAGVLFGEGGGRTSGSYCGRVHAFLASMTEIPRPWNDDTALAARPVSPTPPAATSRTTSHDTLPIDALPGASYSVSAATCEPASLKTDDFPPPRKHDVVLTTSIEPFSRDDARGWQPPDTTAERWNAEQSAASEPLEFDPIRDLPWEAWFGSTRPEQAKTCLALLGLFTLLAWTRRWIHAGEEPTAASRKKR